MPASNAPLDPTRSRRSVKADLSRAPASGPRVGLRRPRARAPTRSALEVDPRGAPRAVRVGAGSGQPGRAAHLVHRHRRRRRPPTRPPPSSSATRSARSSTTRRSPRRCARATTRSAPSGPASTPATTRRSTASTSRSSTCRRPRSTEITERGVRTTEREYEVDDLVFATGFDAMTGVAGRDRHPRAGGPGAHATSGPTAPSPTSACRSPGSRTCSRSPGPAARRCCRNMMVSIEQHVDWIADAVHHAHQRGRHRRRVHRRGRAGLDRPRPRGRRHTLYPQADSWYMGANVPGKPRVFMAYIGGVGAYRQHCDADGRRRLSRVRVLGALRARPQLTAGRGRRRGRPPRGA